MALYLAKRLVLAAFTLLVILFISYLLLRLAPGDPTRSTILGSDSNAISLTSGKSNLGVNQSLRQKLHLDEPIHRGFILWLTAAAHGDFGTSATVDPGRPVTGVILDRLPITLKLNLLALLITYTFAVILGVAAAARPDSVFDRATTGTVFLLYSLPAIWVGLVLQALFSKGGFIPVFPVKGLTVAYADGTPWYMLALNTAGCYVLPVACLAYAAFAGISRYTRAGMIEALGQDYIRTARAKGVSPSAVLFRHAFRNALITLITLFSGILPSLVAGSIIVEQIFGIPGMGSLAIMSLSSRDYPLQMALFAFAGMLTLAGIMISDVLYTLADPRITLGTRGRA
ncbi:MAG: ABC transporter permease [Victivallaceae bacterium]|nr:ABC transporter permease [Victivallaceae bacterium]